MPMRGELPPVATWSRARRTAAGAIWAQWVAAMSSPDLQAVVVFSLIGLVLTLNVLLRLSDFGETVAAVEFLP